jgi:O-antigen/teichoic acid export membrane protein
MLKDIKRVYVCLKGKCFSFTDKISKSPRYRKAILTSIASAASRAFSFLANMLIVRLTYNYLGAEYYGLWMTITGFVFFNTFSDLGIGNGLTNLVAECYGKKEFIKLKEYITNAFNALLVISIIFVIISFVLVMNLNFEYFLKTSDAVLISNAKQGTLILALSFSVNIVLGMAQRIQSGLQEGYKTYIFQFLNSFIVILLVMYAIHIKASFDGIVLAFSIPQLVTNLINNLYLFCFDRRDLVPDRIFQFDKTIVIKLISLGFLFFIIQVSGSLSYSMDNVIIAKRFSVLSVTNYSIIQRLFSIGTIIQSIILMPLWPAYGEAKASRDYQWIWKTYNRTIYFSICLSLVITGFILFFSNFIMKIWLGKILEIPFSVLFGFSTWSILGGVIGGVTATFLNGLSILKLQVYCAVIFSITSFIAKLYLPTSYGMGIIIWSTNFAYLIIVAIPTLVYIERLKRTTYKF